MKKVLIVDDDVDFLSAMSGSLKALGLDVTSAKGANEALKLKEAQEFELILTDISMTEGDGYSLISQLRKQKCFTPILVMTGNESVTEDDVAKLGADGLLTKPFGSMEIMKKMRQLVGAKKA